MAQKQVSVLGNLRIAGAVVMDKDELDFPSNPKPGTLVLKGGSLYAFTTVKGILSWYPLFQNVSDAYLHTQANPSTQWVVNHQLGSKHYWYQIQDDAGNAVYESARQDSVDLNTTTLTFAEPVSGTVIFVGPNSVVLSNVSASLMTIGTVEITTTSVKINGVDVLTANMVDAAVTAATANLQTNLQAYTDTQITTLKDGVVTSGDTLAKLYAIIQSIEVAMQSDDVTLNTIQELVTRIKSDEGLLTSLTTGKVNVTDIVDALTSTATNKPLSAAQGLALSNLLSAEVANRIAADSDKQDRLISNINIKTVNGQSILGGGDLAIQVAGGNSGQASTMYANFNGAITPTVGTARKYIRSPITISNIFAWLGTVGTSDTVINIRVNDVIKQSVTILSGQQTSTTAVTLEIAANDYITIDVVSGSGSNLSIRFDY